MEATERQEPSLIVTRALRVLTVLIFAAVFLYYMWFSRHWRLAVDSPVMHYVVFLMRHGLKPYRDISDNNMPGSYLTEALAMRVFGGGDVGWRLYEFFLVGAMGAACMWLTKRWDWVAGVFAVGLFVAIHSTEGARYAAERELVITVLLLLAYVLLFGAVWRQRPVLLLPFGLICGLAVSIKPTYLPLPLSLLLLLMYVLRRQGKSPWPSLGWACLGFAGTGLVNVLFLTHYRALAAFLFVVGKVLPAYAGMAPTSLPHLLSQAMPRSTFFLLLLTLPLACSNQRRQGTRGWEWWALLLGAVFGLASYLLQRKGFLHHRYTFLVFFFLLLGIEIFTALRQRGWPRALAAACLGYALLFVVPNTLRATRTLVGQSDFELALEGDLRRLGTREELQGKVQCFDLVYGCLNALYHLDVVENSGFTGDLLFFSPQPGAATAYYRERFWFLARRDPADVVVLSNQELMQPDSYERIERWPAFAQYLRQRYTVVLERRFPLESLGMHGTQPAPTEKQDGYRIYLRSGSPLWRNAQDLGLGQARPLK